MTQMALPQWILALPIKPCKVANLAFSSDRLPEKQL